MLLKDHAIAKKASSPFTNENPPNTFLTAKAVAGQIQYGWTNNLKDAVRLTSTQVGSFMNALRGNSQDYFSQSIVVKPSHTYLKELGLI